MSYSITKQNKPESSSLIAQIRQTEYQLLHHQKMVNYHSTRLLKKMRRQMTTPSSLWMAGGTGFMLGELTRNRRPSNSETDKKKAAGSKKAFFPWILTTIMNLVSPHDILNMILNAGNRK